MKYVEQIKSAILLFLVLLSICLTIMIWTYKPVYPIIEENTTVKQVSIGEKRELKDVLKPYRLLTYRDDKFIGTVSSKMMDNMTELLQSWSIENFMLMDNDFTENEMNDFMRMDKRMTFMFNTTMPLNQFSNVLHFSDQDLPQAEFNRMVIDWSELSTKSSIQVYFLNTNSHTAYRANAPVMQKAALKRTIESTLRNFIAYSEIERQDQLSLYIASSQMESIEYEYYIDELPVDIFKNMLFPDTTLVKRSDESETSERFTDGMARMTLDNQSKVINYVYPAAEGVAEISPGKLLRNSFEFVNQHGGFNADYRFSSMNVEKHTTEYQLFVQGYPVYSSNVATRIVTTWGDNEIFRYRRPFYSLDIGGQTIKELPSAEQVLSYIQRNEDIELNEIDEIVVGYYLTQNEEKLLFRLEPSWFILEGNSWHRVMPGDIGGANYGLE